MHWKLDRGLTVAVAVLAALLVGTAWLSYRNTQDLNERAGWVSHTLEVEEALTDLRATVTDAETNLRGYLVSGDDSFLAPYRSADAALESRINRVAQLTEDNPAQQARIPQLRHQARTRMDRLAHLQRVRRDKGLDAARKEMATGEGRQAMNGFLAVVGEMVQEEKSLLRQRQARTLWAYQTAALTGILAATFGLAAAGVVVWLGRRHLLASTQAAARLQGERERLRVSLASIGDAVISVDNTGQVDFMNPAAEALMGWTLAEARGQALEKVCPIINEQTRELVESPVARVLRDEAVVGRGSHTVLVARDGSERPIEESAAPIKADGGRILGVILVLHDVAEKRQTQAVLRRAYAELEEQVRQRTVEWTPFARPKKCLP